ASARLMGPHCMVSIASSKCCRVSESSGPTWITPATWTTTSIAPLSSPPRPVDPPPDPPPPVLHARDLLLYESVVTDVADRRRRRDALVGQRGHGPVELARVSGPGDGGLGPPGPSSDEG